MKVTVNQVPDRSPPTKFELGVIYIDAEGDICFMVNEDQMFWPKNEEDDPELCSLSEIKPHVYPIFKFEGTVTLSNV